MSEKTFYELLQVAIGNRQELSYTPNTNEWQLLFDLSKKQALTAVAFRGLSKLKTSDDGFGVSIGIDEMTYLKWLGLTAKIAQRNKAFNKDCITLCNQLEHDGFEAVILKGQSNQEVYPEDLRECRTSGDIDVWVRPMGEIPFAVSDKGGIGAHYEYYSGKAAVINYVLMNTPEDKRDAVYDDMKQHHIDYPFFGADDTAVEMHFTPAYLNGPIENHRLQQWFKNQVTYKSRFGFNVCGVGFDAVYQLIHIYKHLFSEGIGLRQLLDYYFTLRALHIEQCSLSDRTDSMAMWAESIGRSVPSNVEILHTLDQFGMKKFAGAVMYVLKKVFAMPDEFMLCPASERSGEFLLEQIMLYGNFGQYDGFVQKLHKMSRSRRFFMLCVRNMRFLSQYPNEVIWDPFRRLYNVVWRKFSLWRY